ncbi:MAG: Type III site-specific deoxyribonuclease [candidate division WS6 bacterium 36_33]|uniref:Type III site-specific deoxyribonuclease n=1 Tax=candidate division WS6 bacterium 36_33 TaxID=1641388 RepID=A0A101GZQ7_9BACT|nr:MAG: Type III site-specific deoxyribonuclease [candidate division WS6 bacterium 36_33]
MTKLSQELNTLAKYGNLPEEIPDYVIDNLNPKFELREYQKEALRRFHFYMEDFEGRAKPTQLLYHMATGSGKTLIMAANILYLYKQGYRNFIFFVNSTNIIEKTKENFLNPQSIKYLFNDNITFGAKKVNVKEVENFASINQDDINILFTTIQGLHLHLNEPRENTITYEDFENGKIVLISDEAHHINTLTKNKSQLNKSEKEELRSWEGTVNRIFNSNEGNLLLEYTATAGLDNPAVAEKYEDKTLFEYTLKQFRIDGFSKEVKVLQAGLPPIDRAIQAIIVSQYRRKVAEKNKVLLKPVVLFKANYVNPPKEPDPKKIVSSVFRDEFEERLKNLTPDDLTDIKARVQKGILKEAFDYFEENNISLDNLIKELQEDFGKEKCVSVDSQSESEEKQVLVNTLEDKNNEVRAVFAVEKLNEGWDVLNLFDIVRLYDTRDARRGKPGPTTVSEAQLIGRGARYYPFTVKDSQDLYKRKYDDDVENELRVLEELYYHSAHNPRYIQELRTALRETGIIPEKETKELPLKVKDEFKDTDFWQSGKVFLNEQIKNTREDIFNLNDAEIPSTFEYKIYSKKSDETTAFENGNSALRESQTKKIQLKDLDKNLIFKALHNLTFYRFSHLKTYFPHLNSLKDFVTEDSYLASIVVEVSGDPSALYSIDRKTKLDMLLAVLKELAREIKSGSKEYKGTKEFKPLAVQYVVKDKVMKVNVGEGEDAEYGVAMGSGDTAYYLNLEEKDWYVYQENYGTAAEKSLVKYLNDMMGILTEKFSDVYLLRNQKLFQIYRFSDGKPFEPDYVLFLKSEDGQKAVVYQLFIEPKGQHLVKEDQWKEEFLKEIKDKHEIHVLFKNKKFNLVGLPFYNEGSKKSEFEESFLEEVGL